MNRVDCENNTIPVPPITAGSAKLPCWPIREAVRPSKIIRGHIRKAIRNGDPMQKVNYQISLYPPHENGKIKRSVSKRHQEISG